MRKILFSLLALSLLCPVMLAARRFGGVSTDNIDTGYTLNFTKSSWLIWVIRRGAGPGGAGRAFTKQSSGGAVEYTVYTGGAANYSLDRDFSTTDGSWRFTTAPATDTLWHSLIITYDSGSVSNVPVMYYDGISQSITTTTTPVGSASNNSGNIRLGNKDGNNDAWDGDLANFAFWRDRLLTKAEAFQLGALRLSPLNFQLKLVMYNPISGAQLKYEKDLVYHVRTPTGNIAAIVTGTVGSLDPKVRSFISDRRGRLRRTVGGSSKVPVLMNSYRRRRL